MPFLAEKRTLGNLASKYPMVLMMGPRGCGKSALARQLFPQKSYIDLNDQVTRSIAGKSPKTFLLAFPEGAIVNEIHMIPEFLEAVRFYVDRWAVPHGHYILTSSRRLYADDMDGRLARMLLLGLSIPDMESEHMAMDNPFQVIFKGQLTDVLEGASTVQGIIESGLGQDMAQCINGRNLKAFRDFVSKCAGYCARRISMNSLSRSVGVSAPTIKQWMRVLADFGAMELFTSRENANMAVPFFNDCGVLCNLLGIGGPQELILSPYREAVVKNFAVNELVRGRFARNLEPNLFMGGEYDLVASWNTDLYMIIEPNIEVTQGSMERIRRAPRESGGKAVVLHLGNVTYTADGIDCISFRDWSKLAMGMDYFS